MQTAVTPLSQQDLEQVRAGAYDRSASLDDAGLYPLLRNAVWWSAGDLAGAMVPDFDAILEDPDAHRARYFLIEGRLGGPPDPVGELSRPGPWDGKLQQWGLLVRRDPDLVVVVLLVDPPPPGTVRPGDKVRLGARFYKVWRGLDQKRNPTDYLVFVAKSVAARTAAPVPGLSGRLATWAVLAVLVLLAFGYYMVRRSVAARPVRLRAKRSGHEAPDDAIDEASDQDFGPPLPKDPAEALVELERRRREKDQEAT